MPFRAKPWGLIKPPLGCGPLASAVADLDLVFACLLNEAAGTTTTNLINGIVLSPSGSPTWTPGLLGSGSALSFNATNAIGITTVPAELQNWANFSVSVWFVLGSSQSNSYPGLVCCDAGDQTGWAVDLKASTTAFGIVAPDQTGIATSSNLNTGTLYHGVVTVANGTTNSPTVTIYVNGQQQVQQTGTYSFAYQSGNRLYIGTDYGAGSVGSGGINAKIDHVLISNQVWSPDQVLRLYVDPFYWMQAPVTYFGVTAAPGATDTYPAYRPNQTFCDRITEEIFVL